MYIFKKKRTAQLINLALEKVTRARMQN